MVKNIGLVWLKDDFRIKKKLCINRSNKKSYSSCSFFLYKNKNLKTKKLKNGGLSQSLKEFRKNLMKININLEIIKTKTYKSFFEKLFNKKNFSIYWNKTYEPNYLKFDQYLSKKFEINGIKFKIFKGNILNEFSEVKKNDGTPFKVFTPFWRNAEKFYLDKIPKKEKKIKKCVKNCIIF